MNVFEINEFLEECNKIKKKHKMAYKIVQIIGYETFYTDWSSINTISV